jgi:hypothetical protein
MQMQLARAGKGDLGAMAPCVHAQLVAANATACHATQPAARTTSHRRKTIRNMSLVNFIMQLLQVRALG